MAVRFPLWDSTAHPIVGEGELRQPSFQQEACILDTQRSLYLFTNRVIIIFANTLYLYIVLLRWSAPLSDVNTCHSSFLPSLSLCFKMSWRRLLKETGGSMVEAVPAGRLTSSSDPDLLNLFISSCPSMVSPSSSLFFFGSPTSSSRGGDFATEKY